MNNFDSLGLIDFHAHVLPNADHGSSSLDTSLLQLSMAYASGVKIVVATPHFYPERHTVENFLARRSKAYGELSPNIQGDFPKVILGAEVLICPGIDHMEGIEKLCIADTNVILLELPFSDFDVSYCRVVEKLISRGMMVVLAHADRYPKENIEQMIGVGAKIQLNVSSLCTLFKKKHLYDWIKRGLVVALGSDIHGADKKAYKCFTSAVSRINPFAPEIMKNAEEILNSNKK